MTCSHDAQHTPPPVKTLPEMGSEAWRLLPSEGYGCHNQNGFAITLHKCQLMPLQKCSQLCKLVCITERKLTGAVQLHRGQTELLGDVRVLNCQGFFHLRGMESGTVSVKL